MFYCSNGATLLLIFLRFLSAEQLSVQKASVEFSVPKFSRVVTSSRSLSLSWTVPYFPLRLLLSYFEDKEVLNVFQLSSGTRNYTLTNLEPGTSYNVSLQIYYNSADLETISRVVTTIPVMLSTGGEKMNVEVQVLVKNSQRSKSELSAELSMQMETLLKDFQQVRNLVLYSTRKDEAGLYAIFYMSIRDTNVMLDVFQRLQDQQNNLNLEHIGFAFKVYPACCQPLYYHSFDSQMQSSDGNVLNLKVLPETAFVEEGKCRHSVDVSRGDISIQTQGQHPVNAVTISLYLKPKSVLGFQPILSAVNFNTQLRLEMQEGKIVWMIYKIRNGRGFISSTGKVVSPNEWIHLLVDYSSLTGLARIFIDGHLQKKVLSHVVLTIHGHWMLGLRIGKYYAGGFDYKLDGHLDNLLFFGCTMSQQHISMLSVSCGKYTNCKSENQGGPSVLGNLYDEWDKADKKTSKKRECNVAGTVSVNGVRSSFGACRCKENVESESCGVCKIGYFNLDVQNKDGCTKCFCNGLTRNCRSATMERKQIVLNGEDIRRLSLRTVDGYQSTLRNEIIYNPLTNSVTHKLGSHNDNKHVFYWDLPMKYCGDKIDSYGGNFRFTISYLARLHEMPLYGPDMVLIGNNISLMYYEAKDAIPGHQHYFQVIMDERFWQTLDRRPVTREMFLIALAAVDTILLRATYSTEMIETSLYEVRMDVGSYDPVASNQRASPMIEECQCPAEYFGSSCQHCDKGYSKIEGGELLGRCKPCECNNHADDCDGETGKCRNCQHYTTGFHCEKCLPGYYGDSRSGRPDACLPCPCPLTFSSNQFSKTCILDADGQATCDACEPGYTGRRCERCVSPYVGNPLIPGDNCISLEEISCNDCHINGTINGECDKNSGSCHCKKNVEGRKCTSCKTSSFHLHDIDIGCLKCWCFGVSTVCSSAQLYRKRLMLSEPWPDFIVMTYNGDKTLRSFYQNDEFEFVLSGIEEYGDTVFYWSLPEPFKGAKVSAYDGHLSYKISYDAEDGGVHYNKPDIKIEGNGKVLVFRSEKQIFNRQVTEIKVKFHEKFWRTLTNQSIVREDLLSVLSDVKSLLVRATYSTNTKFASLSHTELMYATPFESKLGLAQTVEKCQCPDSYTGLSCEKCDKGFTRSVLVSGDFRCERCQCNGHSIDCHILTGVCRDCQHRTTGDHCESCQRGYYSNTTGDCAKCLCPLRVETNQFSETCESNEDGGYICDACASGYTGNRCEKCAKGYTGNPETPGGTCKKTAMRYTSSPSVSAHPEKRKDRVGATATFYCTVTGEQPLAILWSRVDGRPFTHRARVTSTNTSQTLVIHQVEAIDQETYICSARNDYGLSTASVTLIIGQTTEKIRVTVTPSSLRMEEGGTARFICSHNSELTSTVIWKRDVYNSLPNEAVIKNGVLTIRNVRRRHSGLYSCQVSNQYSSDQMDVQLRVGVVIAPRVTIQPPYLTVNIGETAHFRCATTGYPAPTVTWKHHDGKTLENEGAILRLDDVQKIDEGDYLCTAANRGGSMTMRSVLFVRAYVATKISSKLNNQIENLSKFCLGNNRKGPNSLPVVEVSPEVQIVHAGTSVTISCFTSGVVQKVAWKRKHGEMPLSDTQVGKNLLISSVDFDDEGTYQCVATNDYGEVEANSQLIVEAEPGFKPKAVISPKFVSVVEGTETKIKCELTGLPRPILLWSKPNGLLTNNHIVNGAQLQIKRALVDDSGTYVCAGKNKFGVDSSTAVVFVERRLKPKVHVGGSHERLVYAGEKTTFFCRSTAGIPKPVVFWKTSVGYRVSDVYIKKTRGGIVLKFREIQKANEGQYICVGSSVAGNHEVSVNLTVRGEPRAVFKPNGFYQATVGDRVSIRCNGYGYPIPIVTMTYPPYVNSSKFVTNKGDGFISLLFFADYHLAGVYGCNVNSTLGEQSDYITVNISSEDILPFVKIYPTHVQVQPLDEVKLFCKVNAVPKAHVYWTKDDSSETIWKKPVLQLDYVKENDGGEYHCHATNRKGTSRVTATVRVEGPITIEIYPHSVTVKNKESFNLKCHVKGSTNSSVEWSKVGSKNFSDLPAIVSNNELIVLSASQANAGTYICSISEGNEKMNSSATVIVVEPPSISLSKQTVFAVNLSSNILMRCNASGYPRPVIKWSQPKHSNGRSFSYGEFSLFNVSKYEQGNYRCQASNNGGVAEEMFVVIINELPRAVLSDTRVSAEFGSNISVRCKVTGVPKPVTNWSRVNSAMPALALIENNVLYLHNITSKEAGTYRCVASNSIGSVLAEVQVMVQGIPTASASPSFLSLNFKDQAKFTCNVTGNPKPSITWSKVNGVLPSVRYMKEDFLIFPSVVPKDAGMYVCKAENPEGQAEAFVELKIYDFLPRFDSKRNSILVFDYLKNTLYNTKIEIWLLASKPSGLVLYSGSNTKDFMSVTLVSAFVVFQFNLGSGPAFMQTRQQIMLNMWIYIEASRDGSLGYLKVNEELVYGKSGGLFTKLNLGNELYLGGQVNSSKVLQNVGSIPGFTGCISEIVINGNKLDFSLAVSSQNIRACNTCSSDPCLHGVCSPSASRLAFVCDCHEKFTGRLCDAEVEHCYPGACLHSGMCTNHENNGYSCKCVLGRFGKRCENGQTITIPSLHTQSHLNYRLPRLLSNTLVITLALKVWSLLDARVLSIAHEFQGKDKSVRLEVRNGRMQLIYNLGDGDVIVVGAQVEFDEWIEVHIELKGRHSSLSVNGKQASKNYSKGSRQSLNLHEDVRVALGRTVNRVGFRGCVRQLVVNHVPIDLAAHYVDVNAVSSCYTIKSPCLAKPCLNNATCVILSEERFRCECLLNFYGDKCENELRKCGDHPDCVNGGVCRKRRYIGSVCMCPIGFKGVSCQHAEDIASAILLTSNTYLVYPKTIIRRVEESDISMSLKPSNGEGLLLWYGQDVNVSPDFLSIGLRNGSLEIQYELGSGLAVGLSEIKLDDTNWHSVKISRRGSTLTCTLDNDHVFVINAGGTNNNLDVYSTVTLGGGLDPWLLSRRKFSTGYRGCVRDFVVEGRAIDFVTSPSAAWNVLTCE